MRTLLLWLIAAAAVLLVLGTGALTSSSASCATCHSMKPYTASLARSAHASVACSRCHIDGGVWGLGVFEASLFSRMYPADAVGAGVTGPGSNVEPAACLSCHAAIMDGRTVRTRGIRINHRACVGLSGNCDQCHSTVAHGKATRWVRQPVMEECVLCHRKNGAPTRCDTCHAGKDQNQRLAVGPWQVTHGPNWSKTHGLGTLAFCSECHAPSYCAQCHHTPLPHPDTFGSTHGTEAMKPGSRCFQCHDRALFCNGCHGMPMPHPANFLKIHPAVAKARGSGGCVVQCHYADDCSNCHIAHIHPGSTPGTLGKGPNGVIALPAPKKQR